MDFSGAFAALFTFLTALLKWCVDGILFVLTSVMFLIFDGLLTCISAIFTAIDISNFVAAYAMSWAGVPPQMIWFINAVSIPAGIIMLTGAIGIRMAINLIPAAFTRI